MFTWRVNNKKTWRVNNKKTWRDNYVTWIDNKNNRRRQL